MWVYNNDDNIFNVGDRVWIANTVTVNDKPFEVTVLKVIPAVETLGLGTHYVLHVSNWIEDHLEIREAKRVFRSKDQFESICQDVRDQRREYRTNVGESLVELFTRTIGSNRVQ